jgi:hypothetical protein
MDMVVQSGINFDAFGVQIQMGRNEDGMHCRDMMQISSVLDYFGRISKPLYITDVEVPGSVGDDAESSKAAGYWRERWNEEVQGEWIKDFYRIGLSKPFVDGVVYGNLCDSNTSMLSNSGLLTEKLEAKQSLKTIRKLRAKIFNR